MSVSVCTFKNAFSVGVYMRVHVCVAGGLCIEKDMDANQHCRLFSQIRHGRVGGVLFYMWSFYFHLFNLLGIGIFSRFSSHWQANNGCPHWVPRLGIYGASLTCCLSLVCLPCHLLLKARGSALECGWRCFFHICLPDVTSMACALSFEAHCKVKTYFMFPN